MFRYLAMFAIVALGLSGCSESTNPSTPTSFLSFKTGTYILSNVDVFGKSSTGTDSVLANYSDSVAVTGSAMITDSKGNAKNSQLYVKFIQGAPVDTTSLSESSDKSKLYRLYPMAYNISGVGVVDFGSHWTLLYDNASTTWTALQDSVSGIKATYMGMELTFDAAVKVNASKTGTEDLTINGAAVKTTKVKLNYVIQLYISSALGPIPVEPILVNAEYWLAENVGIVKTKQDPSAIKLGPPANQMIPFPGFVYTPTKFVIAQ